MKDYHDELAVVLINLSMNRYTINIGERIAQLVIMEKPSVKMELVQKREDLGEVITDRGGGFGSTGRFELVPTTEESMKLRVKKV